MIWLEIIALPKINKHSKLYSSLLQMIEGEKERSLSKYYLALELYKKYHTRNKNRPSATKYSGRGKTGGGLLSGMDKIMNLVI